MKAVMKNEKLTTDEYDALELVRRGAKNDTSTACVGRNAKRLSGLKMIEYSRDGRIALTKKGQEVLFLRRCVIALRALAENPGAEVDHEVLQFLQLKSHVAGQEGGGYALTEKGQESLADIAQQEKKR